jgi:hypothetical protein
MILRRACADAQRARADVDALLGEGGPADAARVEKGAEGREGGVGGELEEVAEGVLAEVDAGARCRLEPWKLLGEPGALQGQAPRRRGPAR